MFWLSAAALAAVALLLMLRPLLGTRSAAIGAQAALLREQLEVLKASHAAGMISDADFAVRKQALSDAVLALVDQPATAPRPRSASVAALILLVGLPIAMVLLYRQVGNPNAIAFDGRSAPPTNAAPVDPAAAPEASATPGEGAPELAAAAEKLAAKLRDNPDDGEGWVLLGRTYRATEQFVPAKDAFERALKLVPETADLLAEYAEVLGLAVEPRSLAGEPEKLLDRALILDPAHQRALWLKGFARKQAGDAAGAETVWSQLLGQLQPGTPVHAAVTEQINEARTSLGKPALAVADVPAPPPGETTSPAADVAGIAVRVTLAPALAEKVKPGAVLFVFARAESGPPMPLAIQRLPAGNFPVELQLDASMGMLPEMSLDKFERVIIGARISMSGNAQAQAGDLEGFSAGLEWRTAGGVEIAIDKVH